jgi:hypothetical protein
VCSSLSPNPSAFHFFVVRSCSGFVVGTSSQEVESFFRFTFLVQLFFLFAPNPFCCRVHQLGFLFAPPGSSTPVRSSSPRSPALGSLFPRVGAPSASLICISRLIFSHPSPIVFPARFALARRRLCLLSSARLSFSSAQNPFPILSLPIFLFGLVSRCVGQEHVRSGLDFTLDFRFRSSCSVFNPRSGVSSCPRAGPVSSWIFRAKAVVLARCCFHQCIKSSTLDLVFPLLPLS